jgi:hypothetical protein
MAWLSVELNLPSRIGWTRDALWLAAGPAMRERLRKLRETDDYTYLSLQEISALQATQEEEPNT